MVPVDGSTLRAASTAPWLLACSADRTVITIPQGDGGAELIKIFETGTLEDAQHELALAARLPRDGVVGARAVRIDAATGRPSLVFDYHPGANLGEIVLTRGPLPPREVARHAVALARTLQAVHAAGFVHGDVKPANVLLAGDRALLIDLEHCRPIGAAAPAAFGGGTHGFAPPEAYAGAPAAPSADVFGFGALLHTALTGTPPFLGADQAAIARAVREGRRRRWLLALAPVELRELVTRCLADDPRQRPSLAEASTVLERLATAASAPQEPPATLARDAARLRTRRPLPQVGPMSQDLETACARILEQAPAVHAFLLRFPSDAGLLEARQVLRVTCARLLRNLPPLLAQAKRNARFAEAERWLDLARQTLLSVLRNLGPLPLLPEDQRDLRPGIIVRDPLRALTLLASDLAGETQLFAEGLARLRAAETRLDVTAADQAIRDLSERNTGASEVLAALRDRTHRLGFYLERIAHMRPNLAALGDLLASADLPAELGAALDLQQLAAQRLGVPAATASAGHGTAKSMQRALQDLLAEFPHASESVLPALHALEGAFERLSDLAWQVLAEASHKLDAVPIPIRPLQGLVHRLDTLRLQDVLVDRPEGSQADLAEGLERLRLRVDQARTTRDRITRSAADALERGHITTALFDMERAQDRFAGEADETGSFSQSLATGIEEARRRKHQLEILAQRNVLLGARHATLQDDPHSLRSERIAVLAERKQALTFLLANTQTERAGGYRQDLRDVQASLLQEHSDQAEFELEALSEFDARLRLCRTTLDMLGQATTESGLGEAPLGRVQRLLERWEQHRQRAQADLRQQQETARLAAQALRRRRLLRVVKVAVLLLLLGGVYEVAQAVGRPRPLAALADRYEREGLQVDAELLAALRAGDRARIEKALLQVESERIRIEVRKALLSLTGD